MSRVAVLGAAGKLGEIVVNRVLAQGHKVHAFGRDLSKLQQRNNENLSAFHGDAETGVGLEPAVAGCRFVISTLDTPGVSRCVTNLVGLLKSPPLERLLFMSKLGVGDSAPQIQQISGLLAPLMARMKKGLYQDFGNAENVLRATRLPYVILRAAWLNDDSPGQEVTVAEAKEAPPSRVARSDLAKFLVRVLEEPGWDRREVTVGSRRKG